MKVIGIYHSVGDYDGKPFDNYNLYIQREENEKEKNLVFGTVPRNFNVNGKSVGYLKVKASILNQVVNPEKIEKLVNRDINVSLDVSGKITKVEVI